MIRTRLQTILYSSHVLDVVEKVCNRVLIIHKGNLIADSTPENLKASTRQSTLEEVFRKLTHAESVNDGGHAAKRQRERAVRDGFAGPRERFIRRAAKRRRGDVHAARFRRQWNIQRQRNRHDRR